MGLEISFKQSYELDIFHLGAGGEGGDDIFYILVWFISYIIFLRHVFYPCHNSIEIFSYRFWIKILKIINLFRVVVKNIVCSKYRVFVHQGWYLGEHFRENEFHIQKQNSTNTSLPNRKFEVFPIPQVRLKLSTCQILRTGSGYV